MFCFFNKTPFPPKVHMGPRIGHLSVVHVQYGQVNVIRTQVMQIYYHLNKHRCLYTGRTLETY